MSNQEAHERFLALQDDALQELPATWVKSEKAQKALALARNEHKKRHGMYAGVPLLCRGESCPYAETCPLLDAGLAPEGERCPLEVSFILSRFEAYAEELDVDPSRVVDMGLLRDLIDCEVIIDRCDRIMAQDGELIRDVPAGSTPDGMVFHRPETHQALAIKERMQRRKNEILQLLNSTRKDHAQMGIEAMDPSKYASRIYARWLESQGVKIVEGEAVENDDKER